MLYDREKLSASHNNFRLVCFQSLGLHQLSANSQSNSASFEKFRYGIQSRPARGNKWDLRERAFESLDVFRASYLATRKNLDKVRASLPRGHDFCRRQCTRNDELPCCGSERDGLQIQSWADEEFRSCLDTMTRNIDVNDSPSSDQDFKIAAFYQFADQFNGAGNCHRDFHR